jgi:small-conductance mechanosensitive channel
MTSWIEYPLLLAAAGLLVCVFLPRLRAYRWLILGGFVLLSAVLFRQVAGPLGIHLGADGADATHLPEEIFGIAWWLLGAWLVRRLLTLILGRTLFPNDNQPHARRLFADLASVLIYLVAFVGIMGTVLKLPITNVLATSGVLAIVLGLALQSTLADVFSGLAINIERPFRAGDWITLDEHVEGQIQEISWRATHIRTASNDIVVIPNSVIAKAIVTNHRRLGQPRWCTVRLSVDCSMATPSRVIKALETAAAGCPGIASQVVPLAHACSFRDSLIAYELYCGVVDFALVPGVQSELIARVVAEFHHQGIAIGALATDVHLVKESAAV